MALLELFGVEASYGPIKALHGVSLSVEPRAIVAILGANGAGKTTTLRAITGLVRMTGRITFDGQDITHWQTENIARAGIAHVPEGRGTLAQLTVSENLQMGAYVRRDGAEVKKDYERIFHHFPWLKERRQQPAGLLSGGEQQMLAIARALMQGPRLLLLDEPSLGLAPMVVRGIFEIVKSINQEQGLTVLLVEQNASLALQAASAAYVLEAGQVAVSGSSQDLQAHESVRKSYLGY